MLMRLWSIFSVVSFGLLILFIIFVTRKPICIDSKLVEKIDRVQGDRLEEAYRCDMNKAVRFSTFWSRTARSLSSRLYNLEITLDRLGMISPRAPRVVILADSRNVIYTRNSKIYISEDLLSEEGWLEKELVQFWLREKNGNLFSQNPLVVQALVENILIVSKGLLSTGIGSKSVNLVTSYVWPQTLRVSSSDCRYLKKFSDNISFCLSQDLKPQVQDIRPYFIKSWMESFYGLKLSEQFLFLKAISELSPEGVQKTTYGTRFLIALASRLEKHGVDQAVERPEFDLVYALDQSLENESVLKKSIQEFSQKYENLRIAIMDTEKVFLLPSGTFLSKKLLKSWNTRHLVYQSCANINFNQVSSFGGVTKKLLLIRSCGQNESHSLQNYYQMGVAGFASQDLTSAFVHFHLPSLALKASELNSSKDIFELLGQDGGDVMLKQSLGWKQVEWRKELKAFSPRAYVDAIDLFRLPSKL